ncbi:AraC family transcriptional regulator [Paenibacillus koleovorans]|uniref:AraC family transcriptional regulator n=1 Tax=Paenibacillus koleovorans TaxID=121608 RepID=UPI0013E31061|nr:AraC family transcriptional regulator [Paenibacillus koleovorans]
MDSDLLVNHLKRTVTPNPAKGQTHYHSNYEIFYLVSGSLTYFVEDRTYAVREGDLVFIDENVLHRTSYRDRMEYERVLITFKASYIDPSYMLYSPVLFEPFRQPHHVVRLSLQDRLFVQELLDKLVREVSLQETGYEMYAKQLLSELLLAAGRMMRRTPQTSFGHPSPVHAKLSRIVQFLNQHYESTLSLQQVAGHFGISAAYLSRTFRTITGFHFVEYLNLVRVREAGRLLAGTDLKLAEVAARAGFESLNHFGRLFKRTMRMTPLQYRNGCGRGGGAGQRGGSWPVDRGK